MSGPTPPSMRDGTPMHERVLLYGGPDSGKTRALLTVAAWHQKRKSPATFHVLTNDMGYEPYLVGDGEFAGLDNLRLEDVSTMQEYLDAARKVRANAKSEDWFAIDLLNGGWEAAQDEYAERRFGVDLSDFWMTKLASAGDEFPIGGWEWGPINKRYRDLANSNMLRMPCHVLCMSGQSGLKQPSKSGVGGETAKVKEMFERIGYKPLGQKDDPHRFHTVLHLSQVNKTKWVMNTARDRNREKMQGVELDSFMTGYLRDVGGWKL